MKMMNNLAVGLFVLSVVFLIFALVKTYERVQFLEHSRTVLGTYVDLVTHSVLGDRVYGSGQMHQGVQQRGVTNAVVEYVTENGEKLRTELADDGISWDKPIPLRYRVDNPSYVFRDDFVRIWVVPMLLGVLSGVTMLMAVFLHFGRSH